MGSGTVWFHLFVICLKPEKFLCQPMQIIGPLETGYSDGTDVQIPSAVKCYVPDDLFGGRSNCLLDLAHSDSFKAPPNIMFLSVSRIDVSTFGEMWMLYENAVRVTAEIPSGTFLMGNLFCK